MRNGFSYLLLKRTVLHISSYRNGRRDNKGTTIGVSVESRKSCLEQVKAALDIHVPTL